MYLKPILIWCIIYTTYVFVPLYVLLLSLHIKKVGVAIGVGQLLVLQKGRQLLLHMTCLIFIFSSVFNNSVFDCIFISMSIWSFPLNHLDVVMVGVLDTIVVDHGIYQRSCQTKASTIIVEFSVLNSKANNIII